MIYLDSAATSLLKPPRVAAAAAKAIKTMASPGRGGHKWAMRAADTVYECRENLARLFHVEQPERIVFTFNATHGLNIAINSLVRRGARVMVSGYEHNSVMRPLAALHAQTVSPDAEIFDTDRFLERAERLIPDVDAVVCSHVSNVFGWIFPVFELGELCTCSGKPFIVDASQSAGCLELNFEALGADFVAFPGHKGLMGPQGTGVLICKNEAKPLLYGGSGSNSILPLMPEELPDRLEAGTHNVPGIAGLNEGVKYVMKKGCGRIGEYERQLMETFARPLLERDDVKLFYSADSRRQGGLVSLVPQNISCEALGEALAEEGIAVRTGLHCAPSAHKSAGTLSTGSVRFSFSPFISSAQARTASDAVKKILKKA